MAMTYLHNFWLVKPTWHKISHEVLTTYHDIISSKGKGLVASFVSCNTILISKKQKKYVYIFYKFGNIFIFEKS